MKYTSSNIFSDFEFHDAYFNLESIKDNTLTISVQYLNIHKNTAQNPCDTDMEIEMAHISFNDFQAKSFEPGRGGWKQDENGNYYTNEPQFVFEGETAKEKAINELLHGATIFEFGTLDNGNHYFEGAGDEPWFHVQFSFDSATVEWDEYRKPAWYEERPFKK